VSLTDLLRDLAPFIAQDWVILSVVALLCTWFGYSAISLVLATETVRRHLRGATMILVRSADAVGFAASFATATNTLANDPLIGVPWRGFCQSLVVPTAPGRPITATADARQWFDLADLFGAAGADLRYHAALPGLLVGAGLLFTFIGLAAALSAAGAVVAEGVSQAQRNAALRDLLGAASVKFITSLVGLGLSITYALFRKSQLRRSEIALSSFLIALQERMQFRTSTALQVQANALLEMQFATLQRAVEALERLRLRLDTMDDRSNGS